MQKSWIALFTLAALVALLIPALQHKPPAKPQPIADIGKDGAAAYTAAKEQKLKYAALQNDVEATASLMSAELRKDLIRLLEVRSGSPKQDSNAIRELMKEHPHLAYVSLLSASGKSVHSGQVPPSKDGQSAKYVAEASTAAARGEAYESNSFNSLDGSRYIVIGTPSGGKEGVGAVAVMKQDVLQAVERHQKRNLRIIPYPAEGNYRIESVKPNSMDETTVETGEDNGNASHYYIRDCIVHFPRTLTERELADIKAAIDAETTQRIGDAYVFRSRSMEAEQMMSYFRKNWQPEYVEPHYMYLTNEANIVATEAGETIVPNDVLYAKYQWNLPSIETEKGWSLTRGDEGVIIAVLDTGVQSDHPDLAGRLTKGMNIISTNKAPDDDVGHGTHVAGIIGAAVNNGEGVAGVSWFNKMMPVKVLDSSGAGSAYSVAQGIIWAVDNGAKVINMSLGNYAQAEFLHDAIKYAYERDVVLVAASGNDNTGRPGYPAAYPEVFAVSATNNNKQKASFSNYGDYIDVAAPGDSIASTYPGSQYAALSGTSMASPHVAALAGLIRSVNPELSNEEVMEIMRVSARDLGDAGKDQYFGYGEIDVVQALQAASNYGSALQTFPQQVKRRLERIIQ